MRPYEYLAKHVSWFALQRIFQLTSLHQPNQYPWAQRHSAASWQNHYAKNLTRLEMLIERHLESHPNLVVSETEAERKRDDKMGKQRRKSTAMRKRDAEEDSEAPTPKKRRMGESDDEWSTGEGPSTPSNQKTRTSSARKSNLWVNLQVQNVSNIYIGQQQVARGMGLFWNLLIETN